MLVLNVDLDQGDLPLRIAFPVMMKNALEWFDGSPAELQPAIAAGSSATVRLPKPENALQPAANRSIDTQATDSTSQPELVQRSSSSQAGSASSTAGNARQSQSEGRSILGAQS